MLATIVVTHQIDWFMTIAGTTLLVIGGAMLSWILKPKRRK